MLVVPLSTSLTLLLYGGLVELVMLLLLLLVGLVLLHRTGTVDGLVDSSSKLSGRRLCSCGGDCRSSISRGTVEPLVKRSCGRLDLGTGVRGSNRVIVGFWRIRQAVVTVVLSLSHVGRRWHCKYGSCAVNGLGGRFCGGARVRSWRSRGLGVSRGGSVAMNGGSRGCSGC